MKKKADPVIIPRYKRLAQIKVSVPEVLLVAIVSMAVNYEHQVDVARGGWPWWYKVTITERPEVKGLTHCQLTTWLAEWVLSLLKASKVVAPFSNEWPTLEVTMYSKPIKSVTLK